MKSLKPYLILVAFLQILQQLKAQNLLNEDWSHPREGAICKIFGTENIGTCKPSTACNDGEGNSSATGNICFRNGTEIFICCPEPQSSDGYLSRYCIERNNEDLIFLSKVNNFSEDEKYYFRKIVPGSSFEEVFASKVTKNPHMVALGWKQIDGTIEFLCNGILYHRNFVLTAAHCLKSNPDYVRLAGIDLVAKSVKVSDVPVTDVFIHPDYYPIFAYNDIAIVKIEGKRQRFSNVGTKVSCLWRSQDEPTRTMEVSGYGQEPNSCKLSKGILETNVTILNNEECQNLDHHPEQFPRGIIDSQICVIRENSGDNICFGGSSGILSPKSFINDLSTDKRGWTSTIVGLETSKINCQTSTHSIYTKISYFYDWIEKITTQKEEQKPVLEQKPVDI